MIKINKQKGFTLIELLVVIAIIGILASIVLVPLSGARAKARDAKRESDIRQISLAMEMYYDENTQYPVTADTDADNRLDTGEDPTPNYLSPWPQDPGGGDDGCNDTADGEYCVWTNTSDQSEYCVFAVLEGGGAFAASEKGTSEQSASPTALSCW